MEKYGYTKGSVSKALVSAVKLWLRYDFESTDEEGSNNRLFESMVDELEEKYSGKYVVIAGGKLISAYDTLDEALNLEKGSRYTHRIVTRIGETPLQRVRLGWRLAKKPAGHM